MKGNDVQMRTFQITDGVPTEENPSGTPIPLTSIVDYKINVYRRNEQGQKVNLVVFRKSPVGNNKQAIEVDVDLGKIGFVVDRTVTLKAEKAVYYCEVEVMLTVGSEYINNELKVGADAYELCEIIDSSNPVSQI